MHNPFEELNTRLERIESLLTSPGVDSSLRQAIEKPVNTQELCEFLGITEPTLLRMRKQKRIPFIQIGSCIRFDKAAVIKALENKSKK